MSFNELCANCGHTKDWHSTGSLFQLLYDKGELVNCLHINCKCRKFIAKTKTI